MSNVAAWKTQQVRDALARLNRPATTTEIAREIGERWCNGVAVHAALVPFLLRAGAKQAGLTWVAS